jgi:prepilin-type N-terminal cleavage/methylation domain-containing protein
MHHHNERRAGAPGRRGGFTIIELVVVIAIIGLLMGAAAFALPKILGGAKIDSTKNDMRTVANALALYYTKTGAYPERGDIYALTGPNGALSKPSDVEDAWGNPYQFYAPSEHPATGEPVDWLLISSGPNQVDEGGQGDDIVLAEGYDIQGGG